MEYNADAFEARFAERCVERIRVRFSSLILFSSLVSLDLWDGLFVLCLRCITLEIVSLSNRCEEREVRLCSG